MLNRVEYLCGKVAEEAGEVAQAAIKCQIFGANDMHPKNIGRAIEVLISEVNDVLGVMNMLLAALPAQPSDAVRVGDWNEIEAKRYKVEHYMKYSRECGCLEEEERES